MDKTFMIICGLASLTLIFTTVILVVYVVKNSETNKVSKSKTENKSNDPPAITNTTTNTISQKDLETLEASIINKLNSLQNKDKVDPTVNNIMALVEKLMLEKNDLDTSLDSDVDIEKLEHEKKLLDWFEQKVDNSQSTIVPPASSFGEDKNAYIADLKKKLIDELKTYENKISNSTENQKTINGIPKVPLSGPNNEETYSKIEDLKKMLKEFFDDNYQFSKKQTIESSENESDSSEPVTPTVPQPTVKPVGTQSNSGSDNNNTSSVTKKITKTSLMQPVDLKIINDEKIVSSDTNKIDSPESTVKEKPKNPDCVLEDVSSEPLWQDEENDTSSFSLQRFKPRNPAKKNSKNKIFDLDQSDNSKNLPNKSTVEDKKNNETQKGTGEQTQEENLVSKDNIVKQKNYKSTMQRIYDIFSRAPTKEKEELEEIVQNASPSLLRRIRNRIVGSLANTSREEIITEVKEEVNKDTIEQHLINKENEQHPKITENPSTSEEIQPPGFFRRAANRFLGSSNKSPNANQDVLEDKNSNDKIKAN
ncbi:hypothetical protein NGRA_2341 [Nosema granulosis]|uniref:Uncharacterized protein n=1 Tax=Nosema granulosis TaxID=83296 RepID=A0A9P6GX87_9MICR|nr:hypothetical protein NGRA_2341 [Nosema granulosis]